MRLEPGGVLTHGGSEHHQGHLPQEHPHPK